jgi:hypothetical protein
MALAHLEGEMVQPLSFKRKDTDVLIIIVTRLNSFKSRSLREIGFTFNFRTIILVWSQIIVKAEK